MGEQGQRSPRAGQRSLTLVWACSWALSDSSSQRRSFWESGIIMVDLTMSRGKGQLRLGGVGAGASSGQRPAEAQGRAWGWALLRLRERQECGPRSGAKLS